MNVHSIRPNRSSSRRRSAISRLRILHLKGMIHLFRFYCQPSGYPRDHVLPPMRELPHSEGAERGHHRDRRPQQHRWAAKAISMKRSTILLTCSTSTAPQRKVLPWQNSGHKPASAGVAWQSTRFLSASSNVVRTRDKSIRTKRNSLQTEAKAGIMFTEE